MPSDEPLYHYAGFKVWSNRVEYTTGFGPWKKSLVLPIKKISSVDMSAMTNKLEITMDDGKKHTFHVMQVAKAHEAILSIL